MAYPPDPHYCRHPAGEGDRAGCPFWPACLTVPAAVPPPVESPAPDLAMLAGWAVGAVLMFGVLWLLLPVIAR